LISTKVIADSSSTGASEADDLVGEDEPVQRIGKVAILGFVIAAGMLLVPLPFKSRMGAAVGDIAHAPLFGGITIAILFLWQKFSRLDALGRDWIGRMVLVGLSVFILGVLFEFAQNMTGRSASMHDAITNGLGIIAAVALCFAALNAREHSDRRWLSLTASAIAMVMIGLALARPVRIITDIIAAKQSFPLINSFEREMELTRWYFDDCRGQRTDQHATDGKYAMRIMLDRAPHPAATLIETVPDWSDVQSLELDVTLARSYPQPLQVILKVIDKHHANYDTDTARKTFTLQPGKTTHMVIDREEMITGPDTRELDMQSIKLISLLAIAPKTATFMDIDHVLVTK
jgi:hypothetical protein